MSEKNKRPFVVWQGPLLFNGQLTDMHCRVVCVNALGDLRIEYAAQKDAMGAQSWLPVTPDVSGVVDVITTLAHALDKALETQGL